MVFFTCSHCGESVRKNKVEKHYQTACSRNPISVTCVDCCKDFSAETFTAHTKCISEEEKYSAKGFQPKPSSNKGEQKQQKWQEVIQSVREKYSKSLSHNERSILDILVKHENVPRKRPKFQNFLRSALKKQYNASAADSVFDKIEAESKQDTGNQNDDGKLNESKEENKDDASMESVKENPSEEQSEENLTKKEKKEKRKREKYEAELKEIEANQMVEDEIESENQKQNKSKSEDMENKENGLTGEAEKKSKKKKLHLEENNLELNGTGGEKEEKKSKKKKKNKQLADENNSQQNGITEMDICEAEKLDDESKKSKKKHKKDKEIEIIEVKEKKKRKKEMAEEDDEQPSEKKAKQIDSEENFAEETSTKTGKVKFNWQDVIVQVLQSKDEKEMSLKRLRKKVLAEFESLGCGCADEKIMAKFNKKINHTPGVVVLKDMAKLVPKD